MISVSNDHYTVGSTWQILVKTTFRAFATSIFSESRNVQFDTEGRISLSEKLLNHAKIKNRILFVGLGYTFQIWEPILFEKFKSLARKKAFKNRSNLKWENKQKGEQS